jgi:hypothetical protein
VSVSMCFGGEAKDALKTEDDRNLADLETVRGRIREPEEIANFRTRVAGLNTRG